MVIGPDTALTQMLLHFSNEIDWCGHIKTIGDDSEGLIDRREMLFLEFHVDHGTNDLHHAAGRLAGRTHICASINHLSSTPHMRPSMRKNWQDQKPDKIPHEERPSKTHPRPGVS